MTKMFPSSFDLQKPSYAEFLFYDQLQHGLSNAWIVFHSQAWLACVHSDAPKREGECDFLIMHKDHGIMIVEVKGGIAITHDPDQNTWYSTTISHNVHKIIDPYQQAKTNKYALLELIRNQSRFYELNEYHKDVNICSAVCFPEIDHIEGFDVFCQNNKITLLNPHLSNIEKALITIFDFHKGEAHFSHDKTSEVIDFLINEKTRHVQGKAYLSSIMNRNEEVIFEATENQYEVLKVARHLDKICIHGCAGSGKTMIATKLAEDFALEGKRVLLVCFNLILGHILSLQKRNDRYLDVFVYDDFIKREYNKIQKTYDYTKDTDEDVYLNLLEADKEKYDVIIVDEAQDFSSVMIETLRMYEKEDGKCFLFFDENQRVHFTQPYQPEGFQKLFLDVNLRNTQNIFDEVKKHYIQNQAITSKGPKGSEIQIESAYQADNAQELFSKLRTKINVLVNDERFKHSDIAIITMKSLKKTALHNFSLKTVSISKFEDDYNQKLLKVDTVRRFKGAESNVVIVTELDGLNEYSQEDRDKLLYVAFSRAKHLLIIMPTTDTSNLDIAL